MNGYCKNNEFRPEFLEFLKILVFLDGVLNFHYFWKVFLVRNFDKIFGKFAKVSDVRNPCFILDDFPPSTMSNF